MKKFLIMNLEGTQVLGSYLAEEKDETSTYRSYLLCPPHTVHYELLEGLSEEAVIVSLVEIEPEREVLISTAVEAQEEIIGHDGIEAVEEHWIKEGEEVLFEDPQDETWTHVPAIQFQPAVISQPAIEARPAIFNIIPAIYGLGLVEDTAKLLVIRQNKANSVLDGIRALREPLLREADIEINKLEDDSLDASAMRIYRKALRECTESLKKVNGDAKLSCENIIASEFIFPIKPE